MLQAQSTTSNIRSNPATKEIFTPSERETTAYLNGQYKQFFGRGEYRFAIYPSYWKDVWGKPPLLGIVMADNEFLAERLASDRGMINPHNATFQPRFKNLGPNRKPIS